MENTALVRILLVLNRGTGLTFAEFFNSIAFGPGASSMASLPKDQACSPCILGLAQAIQATSYSNYDDSIAADWASLQKLCGVSHPTAVQPFPVNATDVPGFAPSGYPVSSTCASGHNYTVVSGDNCQKIAANASVSTGTLIAINNIFPDCSNLEGKLFFELSNFC